MRLVCGELRFDSLDRVFERAAFGGNVGFCDRRLDAAQLIEQRLAGAFIDRLARVRRGLRQSGDRSRDQRMVVCHVRLRALPAFGVNPDAARVQENPGISRRRRLMIS